MRDGDRTNTTGSHKANGESMNLYDVMCESVCTVNIPGSTRDGVLAEIARLAAGLPAMQDVPQAEIADRLLEREQQGSTGFGGGIAIPHARFEAARDFVFFIVTSRKGIAFDAIDGKKVRVFFVLLGPEKCVRDHLKILATVSNIISHTNVTRELQAAITRSALCEIFLSKLPDDELPQQAQKQKLLIVVLYEDDYFYDILDFFLEAGLDGATIIDSAGMGQYISKMPLFASYIDFMNEQKNQSRTLLVTVPDDQLATVIRGIEAITGDLDKKQGAMLIALDIALSKGSMQML